MRKINSGALAGALATIGWWVFSLLYPGTETPDAVVAASVVVLTYTVSILTPDAMEE